MHGFGAFIHSSGAKYIGTYRLGKMHGYGLYYHANGNRFSLLLILFILTREKTFNFQNLLRYEGELIDDQAEGQGTFFHKDGTRFEGFWLKNLRHFNGTLFYPNGNSYNGSWLYSSKNGFGVLTLKNGNKFILNYANNKLTDDVKFILADEKLVKGGLNETTGESSRNFFVLNDFLHRLTPVSFLYSYF